MLTTQRIEELVKGVDFYLQKLDSFTHELREVKFALQELRHSQENHQTFEMDALKREMNSIRLELEKRGLPEINMYEEKFKQLKEIVRLDAWPKATETTMICTTEEAQFGRAQAILDIIVGEYLKDKCFLDFGCGEGHVIMQALIQEPRVAMGYDINRGKFKFNNDHFTSEFDIIEKHGPYNIVLMHDVLDHLETTDAVSVLRKVKKILSNDGRIYIKNHPWCSRHGSHLYTQINKAYIQLIFDESELLRMGGYINEQTTKIYHPIETYRSWINDAGYKICSEVPKINNLEPFFKEQKLVKERIIKHWKGDQLQMINNMQIESVEYVVEPISLEEQII